MNKLLFIALLTTTAHGIDRAIITTALVHEAAITPEEQAFIKGQTIIPKGQAIIALGKRLDALVPFQTEITLMQGREIALEIFDIEPGQDSTSAYRKLSKIYHPDKYGALTSPEEAAAIFKVIIKAHDVNTQANEKYAYLAFIADFNAGKFKYADPKTVGTLEERRQRRLTVDAQFGDTSMIQEKINDGANVNEREPLLGMTPLMFAAQYGRMSAVKLLLQAGANKYLKDDQGYTAADLAALGKYQELVDLINQYKTIWDPEIN